MSIDLAELPPLPSTTNDLFFASSKDACDVESAETDTANPEQNKEELVRDSPCET